MKKSFIAAGLVVALASVAFAAQQITVTVNQGASRVVSVVVPGPQGPPGIGSISFPNYSTLTAFGAGPTYKGQPIQGTPGPKGADGVTPIVGLGSGADSDRIVINGAVQGPHLTGPTGATGAQGATGATGPAGPNLTLAQRVAQELAETPRKVWWVYSTTATQDAGAAADIATLKAAGVPDANIRWLAPTASANTFAVNDLSGGVTMDNVTLTLAGGQLVASDLTSSVNIDSVTLTSSGGGTFAVADLTASTTMDNVTLVLPGTFTVADLTASVTLDTVAITLAGGTLVVADLTASATLDTPTLTAAANFYTTGFNGVANGATTTADGWAAATSGTTPVSQADTSQGHTATPAWHLGAGDGTTGGTVGIQRTMTTAAGTMTLWYKYDTNSLDATLKAVVNGTYYPGTNGVTLNTDGAWHQASITIPAVTSGTVKVELDSAQGGGLWVDDLSIPIP